MSVFEEIADQVREWNRSSGYTRGRTLTLRSREFDEFVEELRGRGTVAPGIPRYVRFFGVDVVREEEP